MKDRTESQHILVIYFRVIFYLLRPSFETEGAVLGTAQCEPQDPLDMEVLSSVRGRVLDVLDGALDDATDPPLTPEPRIKSAVSIRCWARSLNKLGSIRKTEQRTRKFLYSEYHKMAQ